METGGNQDGTVELGSHTLTVDCPYCERQEEIDGELEAKAWLYGHLQVAHGDELPDLEGTE